MCVCVCMGVHVSVLCVHALVRVRGHMCECSFVFVTGLGT